MKKYKNAICFITIIVILICIFPNTSADTAEYFDIKAKAAVLMDMDSGAIMYEKNSQDMMYPASLTKIMTAMLAIKHGDLSDMVTASYTAVTQEMSIYGSTQGILEGEVFSVEDLLYAVMVSSANEACNVLAEYVAGSIEAFVDMMNEEAQRLGCTMTHFSNPHGLHDETHYTCAEDMAKITLEAMSLPDFARICNTTSVTIPATNMSEERDLFTTNYLISNEMVGGYYYPKACGVKTGFTTPAGYCLVSTADNGIMHILGVVMGADTELDFDGSEKIQSFVQMEDLFEWGFSNFSIQTIISSTLPVAQADVKYGADTSFVLVYPAQEMEMLLPNGYDLDNFTKQIFIYNEGSIAAPINRGDVLGRMDVYLGNRYCGSTDLLALTNVKRSGLDAAAAGVKSAFTNRYIKIVLAVVVLAAAAYAAYMVLYNKARRKALKNGTYKGDHRSRIRHNRTK